jgi:hypothetical protein
MFGDVIGDVREASKEVKLHLQEVWLHLSAFADAFVISLVGHRTALLSHEFCSIELKLC